MPCKHESNEKRRGSIHINEVQFRVKKLTRDRGRDEHYLRKKVVIHYENIAIANVHASNNRTVKSVNQKLIDLKGEIDKT